MYYEQFELGAEYQTHGRTITETDVVVFATLTGAQNPLFLDAEYGASTPFGSRIAPGLLSLSMAVGLTYQLTESPFGEGFVAPLGLEFTTPKPVRIGDTLRVRVQVAEKAPPTKGRGEVVLHLTGTTGKEKTVVLEATGRFLVRERSPSA